MSRERTPSLTIFSTIIPLAWLAREFRILGDWEDTLMMFNQRKGYLWRSSAADWSGSM